MGQGQGATSTAFMQRKFCSLDEVNACRANVQDDDFAWTLPPKAVNRKWAESLLCTTLLARCYFLAHLAFFDSGPFQACCNSRLGTDYCNLTFLLLWDKDGWRHGTVDVTLRFLMNNEYSNYTYTYFPIFSGNPLTRPTVAPASERAWCYLEYPDAPRHDGTLNFGCLNLL